MSDFTNWDSSGTQLDILDTSSKKKHESESGARWYHAGFHVTAAMVGGGVLGLPSAFAGLTWIGGLICLSAGLLVTLFTSWLLTQMHKKGSERLPTYYAEVVESLGPRAAHVARVFQIIILVGTGIAYTVLTGDLIRSMIVAFTEGTGPALMIWFAVFIAVEAYLALLPNLHKFRWTSFAALIASCTYCTVIVVLCIVLGRQASADYGLAGTSTADMARGALESLGIIAFAYGGHAIMVEVEAGLKNNPDPRKEMFKGIGLAYGITGVLYFGVACAAYAVFGNRANPDILKGLLVAAPNLGFKIAVVVAQCLVILHVILAFQVYMMPLFELIDHHWPQKGDQTQIKVLLWRVVRRWPILIAQWFIASAFPFFGDILSLTGAVATTTITFVMPFIMYLGWMRQGYAKHKHAQLIRVAFLSVAIIYAVVGLLAASAAIWNLALRTSFNFFQ